MAAGVRATLANNIVFCSPPNVIFFSSWSQYIYLSYIDFFMTGAFWKQGLEVTGLVAAPPNFKDSF